MCYETEKIMYREYINNKPDKDYMVVSYVDNDVLVRREYYTDRYNLVKVVDYDEYGNIVNDITSEHLDVNRLCGYKKVFSFDYDGNAKNIDIVPYYPVEKNVNVPGFENFNPTDAKSYTTYSEYKFIDGRWTNVCEEYTFNGVPVSHKCFNELYNITVPEYELSKKIRYADSCTGYTIYEYYNANSRHVRTEWFDRYDKIVRLIKYNEYEEVISDVKGYDFEYDKLTGYRTVFGTYGDENEYEDLYDGEW